MLLSIHHTDGSHARRLIADLYDSGFTVVEQGNADSDVELLLLTPSNVAQHQAEPSAEKTIIPVILVACDVPPSLSGKEIDLAAGYLSGYRQLLERLHEVALNKKHNPYRGLLAFSETHAPYFFGRQAFLNRLQQHITGGGKLIALVGASASGKTSLIEAGLVPALRNDGNWLPVRIFMQDRPLHQLATRLQVMGEKRPALSSRLEADAGALSQVFNEFLPNGTRLLLVLDMFETAFTRMPLSERVHFLDALYHVIQNNPDNVFVVIALRPESYERLLEYPEWAALLPANRFLVPSLSAGEISEIVEQPARVAGLSIEPNLTQHIVADTARSNPKGLLLRLSFALSALWDSHQFSASRFESIGGVSNAVNQHGESIFRNLSPMQQQIARHVLVWLAHINQGAEVSARVLPRTQFNFTWADAVEVSNTLDVLNGGQILNVFVDQTTGEEQIALSHEALLSEWKRYANWIEEEAQNLPNTSHLERLAADWEANNYSGDFLLRGRELTMAALWVENPDHLYSLLLLDYIAASKQTQQADEKQHQRQVRVRRGTMLGLVASWFLLAAVIVAGVSFASQLIEQRGQFSALQADSATQYAEAALQSSGIAAERDQFATRQAESANMAATYAAQYDIAATALEAAENTLVPLRSTVSALADTLSDNATIQAEMEVALTNQAQAEATTIALENQFREYLASNLAEDAATLLESNPTLALRLAAEAGEIAFSSESEAVKNSVREALANTLEGYASHQIGDAAMQSWLIGGNYVLINPNETDQAQLWQIYPPELIATLSGTAEQVLAVSNGELFIVDYVGESPDEIWQPELGTAVQQLSGELAPPQGDEVDIPNFVQLGDGAYFVLRYDNQLPSELWETATAQKVAALDGDFDKLVPLADGFFFVSYTDRDIRGGVWESTSGEMVQAADNVFAENYDNDIFVLRQDQQFDEIWRTNPFARVTEVVGRVTSVIDLRGHPYFFVRYAGGQPSQIWRNSSPVEAVHTFRGAIALSLTFLDGQYFIVRYADQSPSELWSADPLELVSVLNGSVSNLGLDLAADGQVVILDYYDNTVSELWSPESASRIVPLNGNIAAAFPILGDVYFVVQYEGNQPAEVWAAINPALVGTLGEQRQRVSDIIPLKGGTFLAVLYEDAPGEIWQVDSDGVHLLSTLPDITTQALPVQDGDYLVLDFLNESAQISQLAPFIPVVRLESHIRDLSYNPTSGRLSYIGDNNVAYGVDLQIITSLNSDGTLIPDDDLLALICTYLSENEPISTEQLAPFLAGMPPSACQETTE